MKRFAAFLFLGIVLLTVMNGTVTGDSKWWCPFCSPSTKWLVNDDQPAGSGQGLTTHLGESFSEEPSTIRPTNGNYKNPSLLVYVDELLNMSEPHLVIVDVRSPEKYAEGHIPDAITMPWYLFTGDKFVLTSVDNVTKILGEYGISQENSVVVYSDTCKPCGGPPTSSYVFWILEYLGHENVSYLDGGFDAWNAMYGSTKNITTRSSTVYTAQLLEERFADTAWVENNLNNPDIQIVDARTPDEYNAGHINGAINVNYERLFREDYRMKGSDDLEYLFSPLGPNGLDKSKDTVVYCKGGISSSFLYLALRLMGYRVRNYDES
jgi:thiosulfate/3-mercaptopyruvate sulfurtransferase